MNMLSPSAPQGEPQPFKLRIEDYELLERAGAFNGVRVELIGGMVVESSPQQRPQSFTKNELSYRLRRALEAMNSALMSQTEVTIVVTPITAPKPDIVLTTAPSGEGYTPLDSIALVVEIADTTLRYDLNEKKDLYARAGIGEYWIVDVQARQVHQFWGPTSTRYAQTRIVPLGGELRSATVPDLAIDGTGIL